MTTNPYEPQKVEPERTTGRRFRFWLEWAVAVAIIGVLIAWWATAPPQYPYRE